MTKMKKKAYTLKDALEMKKKPFEPYFLFASDAL